MTVAQAVQTWMNNPKFLIAFAIILLFVMIRAGSARQRRELSAAHDKVCDACGSGHPPFAQFCRKCGKKL